MTRQPDLVLLTGDLTHNATATEWAEFKELDWAADVKRAMKTALVVDGRNFLDREAMIAAGFEYEGVGR